MYLFSGVPLKTPGSATITTLILVPASTPIIFSQRADIDSWNADASSSTRARPALFDTAGVKTPLAAAIAARTASTATYFGLFMMFSRRRKALSRCNADNMLS